jgi:sulfatase modifying factor 1
MKTLLNTLFLTLANLLSNKHGLRVFCGSCSRVALIAFILMAEKPSFADMQPIDSFTIDRTEVTVGQFRKFVAATGYTTAAEKNGGGLVYGAGWEKMDGWVWSSPFGTAAKSDEPAVHVTFDDAKAYCSWNGKRLPRDKEWAKAAFTEFRLNPPLPFVTGVTYTYPTGDTPEGANCLNDCGLTPAIDYSAQLSRGIGHALAGTTKAGVNGLFDMGANVWEWTENGGLNEKRTRGGSWWYGSFRMRANDRATKPKDMAVVYIGFRCIKDTQMPKLTWE